MSSARPHPSQPGYRKALAAAALAIGLLVSACGTSQAADTPSVASLEDDGASKTEKSDEKKDPEDISEEDAEKAQLKYEQCMSDNGVDTEELFGEAPSGDGEEGDSKGQAVDLTEEDFEAYEEANKECEQILEDAFGDFELSPEQEAEQADAELKFNKCMSDKGIDFSDGEDGAIEISEEDFDQDKFDEAVKECDKIFEELFEEEAEGDDK